MAGVTDDVRQVGPPVGRLATWPVWAGLVCIIGLTMVAVTLDPRLRYAPLVASVLLLGLPHGAADYLVPARLADYSRAASMATVGAVYLLFGGGYALFWFVAPSAAAALFVALTWLHWGQGDVQTLVAVLDAEHLDRPSLRAGTLLVRGGLPMVVPVLAFPERYVGVVDTWVGLFGGAVTAGWLRAPGGRVVVGVGFLALAVGVLGAGYRRAGATRAWRIDAAETGLLTVVFASVPPVIAVGAYFATWHSLRHVGRLVALDDGARNTTTALSRFARQAAPLTALAVLSLVGFGRLVPTTPSTTAEFVATYLVFVSVLTLPHVAVVSWMDHREGLWTPR